jgi:predicted deacetylase
LTSVLEHEPQTATERGVGRVRAVALHDVQPRSFNRCLEIRDWLGEQGVDRVTLLVIPAPGRHSFARRSPALHDWVHHQVDEGDVVAQHGLLHDRGARRCGPRRELVAWFQGGAAAEFVGLAATAARERVRAGRVILNDAGFDPHGFVAPGYAYTPALRAHLRKEFDWYADLARVFAGDNHPVSAPAFCLGTSGIIRRPLSPLAARGFASFSHSVVRIDVHPEDFDHRSHKRALTRILERTSDLPAVVYDDLVRS